MFTKIARGELAELLQGLKGLMVKYYSELYLDDMLANGQAQVKMLDWQKQGLQETATGYGGKLTTRYVITDPVDKKTRRVYAICYSNCASHYIIKGGERLFLHTI